VPDKAAALEALMAERGLDWSQVAFLGNDPIATPDAIPVQAAAITAGLVRLDAEVTGSIVTLAVAGSVITSTAGESSVTGVWCQRCAWASNVPGSRWKVGKAASRFIGPPGRMRRHAWRRAADITLK